MWGSANNDFSFFGSEPKAKQTDNSEKIQQINSCITNIQQAQNGIYACHHIQKNNH